jgi:SAM-dependent methyltransferase
VTGARGGSDDPQVGYWNEWNRTWRFRDDLDGFMERQRDIATSVAQDACLKNARILDVGCGTGWLANALLPFGQAWGTDLSPEAIEDGRRRHPDVRFLCGDFLELDLEGSFQLVVSSDSLPPMPDHAACVARIASLQTTGDTFLLMTMNPFVWRRRSTLRPLHPSVPHGRLEDWPTLRQLRRLLQSEYRIEDVRTFAPGGNRGVLFWVENRYAHRMMGGIVGEPRWKSLLERARLGRELVIVARRK